MLSHIVCTLALLGASPQEELTTQPQVHLGPQPQASLGLLPETLSLQAKATQTQGGTPPVRSPNTGNPLSPLQQGVISEQPNIPHASLVESAVAFNFLSPNSNSIDGGSSGTPRYTAWNFGFGPHWNNVRTRAITASVDSPLVGDGAHSIDTQVWITSRNQFGTMRDQMVSTLGIESPGLRLAVLGSFSTYNTGGSIYGNPAGGVPPGWFFNDPASPGSMGLSHLWIDGLFWNHTDTEVNMKVSGLRNGTYALVFWLNPTNHDPKRSALIEIQGQIFRIHHIEGVDYTVGNRLVLEDVPIEGNTLDFDFKTFQQGGSNQDSSLAGFAALKIL